MRASGEGNAFALALGKVVADIDRTQPVYDVQTLEHALSDSIAPRRFNLLLLGVFASVALALAIVGIYGVMSYAVTRPYGGLVSGRPRGPSSAVALSLIPRTYLKSDRAASGAISPTVSGDVTDGT